jgi:hypothetical protein
MWELSEGLRLNNVAVIDSQSHKGNFFNGPFGGYGAVNLNDNPQSNVAKSVFVVNPSTYTSFLPTFPVAPATPNDQGWFDIQTTGSAFSCPGILNCQSYLVGGGGSLNLRQSIASDSTITSEYVAESKSIARQQLFTELIADSTSLSLNAVLNNFVSNNTYGNIGKLATVRQQLGAHFVLGTVVTDSLVLLDSLLLEIQYSTYNVDSLIETDTSTAFVLQKSNALNQLKTISDNRTAITTSQHASYLNAASQAIITNNQVNAVIDPEVNHKSVNQFEAGMRSNGLAWVASQKASILNIASQCPYKGGEAVYRARLLLKAINDTTAFEDESVCLSQGVYRQNSITDNSLYIAEVTLIPNPASDILQVHWDQDKLTIHSISIYDSRMQLCLTLNSTKTDSPFNINIGTLAPGVYTVAFNSNINSVMYKKLIVIK